MTTRPSRRSPRQRSADSATGVTGVASGSLGTGANLDDTQVMRTSDLDEPEASPGALSESVASVDPAPPAAARTPATVPYPGRPYG